MTKPQQPPILELCDADIMLDRTGALLVTDVNWRLEPGDFWVVGGLQWAGKSAWLATAGAVQRPGKGTHLLFGRETVTLSEDELVQERQRVGLVFEQGGCLFSRLTVAENIALPLEYHREDAEQETEETVSRMLELMGLAEVAGRMPNTISRSLQHRAALARALVMGPEALLLDNPLSGLPARDSAWWVDLLAQLHAGHAALGGKKMAIVVTADDFRPWREQGTHFAILDNKHWRVLGGPDGLSVQKEPLLQELLATGRT